MEDEGQGRHGATVWGSVRRVVCSILGAGVTYVAWMASFLVLKDSGGGALRALLWLVGPAVTALGFAGGLVLHDRLVEGQRHALGRIYLWPLVGCAVGAGAVFPFGPMLIVFGMFVVGTASMALRELAASR